MSSLEVGIALHQSLEEEIFCFLFDMLVDVFVHQVIIMFVVQFCDFGAVEHEVQQCILASDGCADDCIQSSLAPSLKNSRRRSSQSRTSPPAVSYPISVSNRA